MKKYFISAAMLVSALVSAQETQPKLEAVGDLVKATYYYDNGQIAQEGFFKDGKADGKWIAFDMNGNKKSIGEYASGEKTGKWFFWNDAVLSEVDYSNSRIASVQNWKQDAIAKK
ncbi:MAG: membrane-binding protein [Flavobacterium sp.]|uniref:toxin-antitoxin system YwqK family antitoxin n=1 Tax=Flavobacterium sp. TaxID=239 RepID=UPI001207FC7D|nr:membrane-binding protein [Flavobacterium sp.]RZJ68737.1 MAG: membrane-binding protein [Flavobacterium sp.]